MALERVDKTRLIADLKTLSSPAMQGRKALSKGSEKAQDFIVRRFRQARLKPFNTDYRQRFYKPGFFQRDTRRHRGTNVIGWVEGTHRPQDFIVITAHYDHLGVKGRRIYPGADDNASGVAAMLALADFMTRSGTRHSVIFVATDSEEQGLYGVKDFLERPPVAIEQIRLNINLDMLGRGGGRQRLYVAGTRASQPLKEMISKVAQNTSICLKTGHDGIERARRGSARSTNWRKASDHAEFHQNGIPYLYFGVDTHRDYHQPSDTFNRIDQPFYAAAVNAVLATFELVDGNQANFSGRR